MTFATSYSYGDRNIIDLKTLWEAVKFILVNSVLVIIFLFLTVEELEWTLFSSRESITDQVIDNTSWNIKALI